jgi:YD repeat-containing protein
VTRDGGVVESYEYDENGNRTRMVGPNGTQVGTYDEQDRLLSFGDATFAYTANGELQNSGRSSSRTGRRSPT